jgi:MerR family transcriptional regulator, light-induced transcriptional regulator
MNVQTKNNASRASAVQESPLVESLEGDSRDMPGGSAAARAEVEEASGDGVALRLAVLARAIEDQIIPRLMLAHPTAQECLLTSSPADSPVSEADVKAFAKLVLAPDENVAQACIAAMRISGISVETIYTDLLAPVARHLGYLWEEDLCDFTEVTLGLGRLHQVLRELSPAFGQANANPSGLRALLLPGPGDQHTFGLVMVAEFFRRAGWDVGGGAWEAGADPVVMVQREWFDVVGFSLGNVTQLDDLAACIKNVREAAVNKSICVLVGGPLFLTNPEYVAYVNADAAATDGAKAPELAARWVESRRKAPI